MIAKTAQTVMIALSLTSIVAQAHTPKFHPFTHEFVSGSNATLHSINYHTIPSQSSVENSWQAANSKRHAPHENKHQRPKQYGYNKPKNPYNNGIHSPNHKFYRGEQLPDQYRGSRGQRYEIEDWHQHDGLYAPPEGMRWSYIDGRYILATIATGIIYNIIYGH